MPSRRQLLALPAILAAPRLALAQEVPGQVVVALGAQPVHVNMAIASGAGPGVPGCQVFAGLVELDDGFRPWPYLAESWAFSEDGLRCRFTLRGGAKFHDGQPITSADVAFSVGLVRQYHPFGKPMFGPVREVATPDAGTAEFVLSEPHPALLTACTTLLLPIMPRHIYAEGNIRTNPANMMAVGSGPFRVTEFRQREYLLLDRFEEFFLPGRPKASRLVMRPIEDAQALRLALERGEVDAVPHGNLPYRDFARMRENPALSFETAGFAGLGVVNYLEFNLRKPPFDDIRVRRAIAHAIDKTAIVQRLHAGVTQVLDGPLPPDHAFASTDLARYPYDLALANRLLDEAGHRPGPDGIRFRTAIDAPLFSPDSLARVADFLRPQLKRIGIEAERRVSPDNISWMQRVAGWEFEIGMGQIYNYPDPVIGTHRLYRSDNQVRNVMFTNTMGYANPAVDEALAAAGRETDATRRKALYARFQRLVTEDLPMIFTTTDQFARVTRRNVQGMPATVLGGMAPLLDLRKA